MGLSLLCLLFVSIYAQQEKDLVTNLPGLQFEAKFKTYSGYVAANQNKTWQMHYILTESKANPDTDPVLVWFSGGPGCSSFAALFQEHGPFFINFDGKTLYENKYSWNAKANFLFFESPIGVGFSYDRHHDSYTKANDDQTAWQNFYALKDFFETAQPKYKDRTFFLSGESYAGIYVPTLSKLVVEHINKGQFPNKNFQGAAIGNGFMNVKYLLNSLVLWSAYHGRVSVDDWDYIKANCAGGQKDMDKADFTVHMVGKPNGIDYTGANTTCGQKLTPMINLPKGQVPYNYYQDCYDAALIETDANNPMPADTGFHPEFEGTADLAANTATLINYISTDNQWGYPCWSEAAIALYLNRRDVQDAVHIPQAWRNQATGKFRWTDCNSKIYDSYRLTYDNTNIFFDYVIKYVKTPNFRFLIYSGDTDTVCNYLGDEWHMRDVAKAANLKSSPRKPWHFSRNDQVAGYNQRYSGKGGSGVDITLDVMVVKGAGHMVPSDRPGPAVQMITNFMFPGQDGPDYSSKANVNPNPPLSRFLGGSAAISLSSVIAVILWELY